MNKSSFALILTAFLLLTTIQVECRRTYSSRSSSSGRGNRGKNQPSGGGLFSSWFGGSKSSGSGSSSGSISKPAPSSAKKNWQTATSHSTSQSKPSQSWANPYYKPAGSAVPSAPKEPSYGWKPAAGASSGSSLPSSNIGSRGYPVQSGVQQSNFGGYKPASTGTGTGFQPSQTGFGGYKPASNPTNTHYQPSSNTHFQPSSNTHYQSPSNTHFQPSSNTHYQSPSYSGHQTGYNPAAGSAYRPPGGYQPSPSVHGYQPTHGVPPPSYNAPSYHPSASYPQASGGYAGYHPSHSYSSFGSAAPTYQGTKLFGGSSGHYGYPSSGSWGIDTYGARKSSGTGKLLTGLAVGAAGGYLTSSLVNSISNPWKYSGYGYGSRYGYDSGLGYGSGIGSYGLTRSESAFERGYERGLRDRKEENNKEAPAPAPAPAEPEDPTSKWVHCVAFDPQTQQTLINPNCSCTVTTSVDERTGQPLSVHHCTTLNGLVMKPIPVSPTGVNLPPPPPANGVNAPGAVPSYGNLYQENGQYGGSQGYGGSQYGAGPGVYSPLPAESKPEEAKSVANIEGTPTVANIDKGVTEAKVSEITTETKLSESTTENKKEEISTGTVTNPEAVGAEKSLFSVESAARNGGVVGEMDKSGKMPEVPPGAGDSRNSTAEFFGQLQKIVNMGNFVDGG